MGVCGNRGNGEGSKKYNLVGRQRDVKNSIGSGVAKELTCMTHEHELRVGGGDYHRE